MLSTGWRVQAQEEVLAFESELCNDARCKVQEAMVLESLEVDDPTGARRRGRMLLG